MQAQSPPPILRDYRKNLDFQNNSTIMSPMKTALSRTASTLRGLHGMNRNLVGPGADRLLPILLAVTPAVFAAFALGEVG